MGNSVRAVVFLNAQSPKSSTMTASEAATMRAIILDCVRCKFLQRGSGL